MSAQVDYSFTQAALLEGQRSQGFNTSRDFLNPRLPQISTVTFGGTIADGVYSVTIAQPDGAPTTFTITRATTPATNTLLGDALVALIAGSNAMLNVASAVNASGVVTITFKKAGLAYPITVSTTSTGTIATATTQPAGGSNVRVGAWVRRSATADNELRPVVAGTVVAELVGIAERTYSLVNDIASPALAYDAFVPSAHVPVGRHGTWAVRVWTAVTPASTPHVWIDAADATGFPGQMGATLVSSKSIDVSSLCRFISSAAAGEIAQVELFFGV